MATFNGFPFSGIANSVYSISEPCAVHGLYMSATSYTEPHVTPHINAPLFDPARVLFQVDPKRGWFPRIFRNTVGSPKWARSICPDLTSCSPPAICYLFIQSPSSVLIVNRVFQSPKRLLAPSSQLCRITSRFRHNQPFSPYCPSSPICPLSFRNGHPTHPLPMDPYMDGLTEI